MTERVANCKASAQRVPMESSECVTGSVIEGLPGGEGERVRVRLPALHMELAQCWVIGLLCVNMSVGGGRRARRRSRTRKRGEKEGIGKLGKGRAKWNCSMLHG